MNLLRSKHPHMVFPPGIILVLAFNLIPFIDTLITSFKNAKLILPEERFAGFDNYQAILTPSRFWYSLFITLSFTFVSISLEAVLGLCLGLMMNRLSPVNNFLRILILIPWTIPTVVTAKIWQWMFDYNLGILNYLFEVAGIHQINWLGKPFLAFFSLVIADVWKTAPFVAVIVMAGVFAISQENFKGSVFGGANNWGGVGFFTPPL